MKKLIFILASIQIAWINPYQFLPHFKLGGRSIITSSGDSLLLETGDNLLLQDGGNMLLE